MSFLLVFIALVGQLISPHSYVFADDQITLENKIKEYTQKLEELAKSKDTLANQIKIITSQIDLTLLKISQTEFNVSVLVKEISSLSVKIADLDVYLNQLSSAYIEQVAQNYKFQKRIPSFLLFSDSSFNSWLELSKYKNLIQKNSQDTLLNLETTALIMISKNRKKNVNKKNWKI
jgi:septal ring factor EnvC (AmiA/AmiB activator)